MKFCSLNRLQEFYYGWKSILGMETKVSNFKISMKVSVENVLNLIVATAILHNLAIDENEDIPNEWMNYEEDNEV